MSDIPKGLPLNSCKMTFLGEVCRTRAGYQIKGRQVGERRITADDARALAGGAIMSAGDLAEIGATAGIAGTTAKPPAPKKRGKKPGG